MDFASGMLVCWMWCTMLNGDPVLSDLDCSYRLTVGLLEVSALETL